MKERPKSVVIFLNPIGGSGNSESIFTKEVEPILKLASIKYELIGKLDFCYHYQFRKADNYKVTLLNIIVH